MTGLSGVNRASNSRSENPCGCSVSGTSLNRSTTLTNRTEPRRTIVVVIAPLGAPDLVAHEQHRRPDRQQGQGQEVLHLAIAQLVDVRILGGAFDAAVPAQVLAT